MTADEAAEMVREALRFVPSLSGEAIPAYDALDVLVAAAQRADRLAEALTLAQTSDDGAAR